MMVTFLEMRTSKTSTCIIWICSFQGEDGKHLYLDQFYMLYILPSKGALGKLTLIS
jgi:hypothetical protein